jgi:hypothetical protein
MKKISAQEGTYLTQKGDVPDGERVYCTELICPDDSEQNWINASEEEYLAWMERIEQLEQDDISD